MSGHARLTGVVSAGQIPLARPTVLTKKWLYFCQKVGILASMWLFGQKVGILAQNVVILAKKVVILGQKVVILAKSSGFWTKSSGFGPG